MLHALASAVVKSETETKKKDDSEEEDNDDYGEESEKD